MKNVMNMSEFEIEEIGKVVEVLEISNNEMEKDKSEFFKAWDFGKPEGSYEYVAETKAVE